MKNIFFAAVLAIVTMVACNGSTNQNNGTTQNFSLDTTKLKSGSTYYQCEMDPEIVSDKPGKCPTCEMDLTEIKKH
ncbi:MAG: hypothetical protein KG003_14095 [Bacteroidetes bacterium]|nr:hypothetical protein [Bacteroidota bacterium]